MKFSRRVSLAAGVVVVGAFLAGCTVPATGVIGLAREGNDMIVLVSMCPDFTSHEISIAPPLGQPFFIPRPTWKYDDTANAEIGVGSASDLAESAGVGTLKIDAQVSSGLASSMRFSAELIESLGDGDVIAGDPTFEVSQLRVDRDGFDQLVAGYCEDLPA